MEITSLTTDLISQGKRELRQRTLNARDQLRPDYREACSVALKKYVSFFEDVSEKVVSGFWPIRSEIDPRFLMEALQMAGATIALPVVVDRTTIEFRAYQSEEELIPSGFGTFGPPPSAQVVEPEIMLVPLSVFDCYGGRIGYGAGHYDRAITRLRDSGKNPLTVGIAFALQEVTKVPQDGHDIRLDYILTHEGIIHPDEWVLN